MKPGVSFYMEARDRFRRRIHGIDPQVLAEIITANSNKALGWWRSMKIRGAWREMCRGLKPSESEQLLRHYCPGVSLG